MISFFFRDRAKIENPAAFHFSSDSPRVRLQIFARPRAFFRPPCAIDNPDARTIGILSPTHIIHATRHIGPRPLYTRAFLCASVRRIISSFERYYGPVVRLIVSRVVFCFLFFSYTYMHETTLQQIEIEVAREKEFPPTGLIVIVIEDAI